MQALKQSTVLVTVWRGVMLHKLKVHLIIIYSVSTGLILIAAMVVTYLLNVSEVQKHSMENFLVNADSLATQLQSNNMLNLSDLAVMEATNQMIIQIEDNGIPTSFTGSYKSKTDRAILIEKAQKGAMLEGINAHRNTNYNRIQRSSVMRITGDVNETYYGCVIVIPMGSSVRSLTLLYTLYNNFPLSANALVYIGITVIGIILLVCISYILIGKTLKPVIKNKKKQEEFIASASHELRSPLAYIQTATGTLTTACLPYLSTDAKQTVLEYIENTNEECSRMSNLIEDMLLLACADNKSWSVNIKLVDGDTFFIESYEALNRICRLRNHPLEIKMTDSLLGEIPMDAQRIFQIMQILINNAISYTPEHSIITIAPYIVKKQLYIDIIDHGMGIPDSEKEKVFDRYYRHDKARTDKNHYGLGLSIAKELVLLHSGKLTLRDTEGGGCTFRIKIVSST